jgi:hypothetical protein
MIFLFGLLYAIFYIGKYKEDLLVCETFDKGLLKGKGNFEGFRFIFNTLLNWQKYIVTSVMMVEQQK